MENDNNLMDEDSSVLLWDCGGFWRVKVDLKS